MNMVTFVKLATSIGFVDTVIVDICKVQVDGGDVVRAALQCGGVSRLRDTTISQLYALLRLVPKSERQLEADVLAMIELVEQIVEQNSD